MVIFGAVDFTAALCRVAKVLGYKVTVCDAREVFATRARFPLADEVVVDWPDRVLARLGPTPRPGRRGVRAHPRPQVRRPGDRRRARQRGRLPRRDGQPAHPRGAHAAARRGGRHRRRRRSPASMPPSASTSVPAHRRRRRSRSAPRSSRPAPDATGASCATPTGPSTRERVRTASEPAGTGVTASSARSRLTHDQRNRGCP